MLLLAKKRNINFGTLLQDKLFLNDYVERVAYIYSQFSNAQDLAECTVIH